MHFGIRLRLSWDSVHSKAYLNWVIWLHIHLKLGPWFQRHVGYFVYGNKLWRGIHNCNFISVCWAIFFLLLILQIGLFLTAVLSILINVHQYTYFISCNKWKHFNAILKALLVGGTASVGLVMSKLYSRIYIYTEPVTCLHTVWAILQLTPLSLSFPTFCSCHIGEWVLFV